MGNAFSFIHTEVKKVNTGHDKYSHMCKLRQTQSIYKMEPEREYFDVQSKIGYMYEGTLQSF